MVQKPTRLQLEADTEEQMRVLAGEWDVSLATVAALAVEAQSANPTVAQRANATLGALNAGTAVPWRSLTLPTSTAPTLTLAMGAWVDSPSTAADPISRAGRGVKPNWAFNHPEVVAAVRAYWEAAPKAPHFRIVGFRLGLPVAHLWANSFAVHEGRIYADVCLVESNGQWVDADSGAVVAPMDGEDVAVSEALAALVATPSKSRNPVSWLRATGVR